jgi:NDP-sugar pyrophosphorylase family protein
MSRRAGQHAVILAGGQGVRLRPYTTSIPKPLVPIGGELSILEIVLRQLRASGFESVTLAIGHLGQIIRAYVGDGSQWGLDVEFHLEESPLGTVGPLLMMRDDLPEHFLVMNGDILTNLNYRALMDEHAMFGSNVTVATYKREVKIDFGVLEVLDSEIVHFREKPTLDYSVSMGVYGMSRSALERYAPGTAVGFDDLMLDQLREGRPPRSFQFSGYWLDIGRPDDYDRANAEFGALREDLLPPLQPRLRMREVDALVEVPAPKVPATR